MRAWKVVVPILLICSTALAIETRLPFRTVFKGQDQFNRLVSLAQSNDWKSLPIGERTAVVGQALTGTRYKSYTLEIDNRIESPSVNFNGLDCWTFFETSLEFARMLNESEAFRTMADCIRRHMSASRCGPPTAFCVSCTLRLRTITARWSLIHAFPIT